ncbi:hypothetical protein M1413_01555 [Patescibacteria group bacterium]|jgi:hypothetical protein|nr:hypothetical protein [Patescibacteria group bacterium]MCL5114477.1 hypothetical protein [Patescibacteria group bacterium]
MNPEKISFQQPKIEGPLETAVEKAMRGEIAWEKSTEEIFPMYDEEAVKITAELQNIKDAPKEYRELLVGRFKEKLKRRIEGLAAVQAAAIAVIEKNPDIPKDDLLRSIKEFGSRYGMTQDQEEMSELLMDLYEFRHAKVREIRQRYPKDRELFKVLFGGDPEGKVEIIEGPVTLYVRCENLDDYTRICSQKFLKKGKEDIQPSDRENADRSGGAHVSTSLIPDLEGAIIAEKSGWRGFAVKEYINSKGTQKHEEQHALWAFFSKKIERVLIDGRLEHARTDEEKELALKHFLRFSRQDIDYQASNEILAYCAEGVDPQKIYSSLTKSEAMGGLYEYFNDQVRLATERWVYDELPGKLGKSSEDFKKLLDKDIGEVYVTEYHKLLKEGIESFGKLKKAGYSTQKAIAVFTHEPLSRWKKTADRLLEQSV